MCKGRLTNSVDDLVDHDLAKIEFLVLLTMTNVLCDHCNAIVIVSETLASTVGVAVGVFIVIKSADTGRLANAAVSKSLSPVVLPTEVERLQEQKNGNADKSHQQ